MKRLLAVVVLLALAFAAWLFMPPAIEKSASVSLVVTPELIARGEYLARVGDCAACHDARGGARYAGGRPLRTPFGTFYSSNLTPDKATGLGDWSADDFWNALHHGRARNGDPLYTAFPYDSYTRVTREDSDALFAFLRSLPAVPAPQRAHQLEFPYNQRWLLRPWQRLFFTPQVYEADAQRDAQWNRGAYLVQGLGHCSSCHSERNRLGATVDELDLAGAEMPGSPWYAPPLTPAGPYSLEGRDPQELAQLLHTGQSARAVTVGPMAEVVHNSLQYLSVEDIAAIVHYLQNREASAEPVVPRQLGMPLEVARAQMKRGAPIYEKHCADCHGKQGEGVANAYPPLTNNPDVTGPGIVNLVQTVVNGGYAPGTAGNPRPHGMPPYAGTLSDEDIAAVLTYVRQSWGNQAQPVSPVDVGRYHAPPVW